MRTRFRLLDRLRRNDAGFTLMELLVVASLLGLVITIVGSIMVSLFTTERTVAEVTEGTTSAQLAATSIDARISQSSSFQVTTVGSDQLLVARVAGRGSTLTWECHAWYYSADGNGSIRSTVAPDGTLITAPSASQLATWTSLITGVLPSGSTPIFVASGDRLTTTFEATAGSSKPVAIRLTSIALSGIAEESTCF